jgi:hypothetical protein
LQKENTSATKSTKGQSVALTQVQDINEKAYYFVHAFYEMITFQFKGNVVVGPNSWGKPIS